MKSLKVKLLVIAAAGVLAGAGLIYSCGGSDDALTTAPAEQTQIAQDASAEAIGIATEVTNIAMALMQGGMLALAPQSPIRPQDKFEWENNPVIPCPYAGKVEILPNGCWLDDISTCDSLEIWSDYAEGCTEAAVWKEGEASILLEAMAEADLPSGTEQGYRLTVSFTDFLEGSQPLKNGEMIFTAASSLDELSGQLKIETGDPNFTEGDKETDGYALMTYSANGTVGVVGKNKATEANLSLEADVTSTESGSQKVDLKYEIVSDMSGKPGDPEAGINTIDISGTGTGEWGILDLSGGQLQLQAQGMTIDPACAKNPVAGTLGVKGTDEDGVVYDVLLTFHSTCDRKAEAKITVTGEDVSGTYEGTISLQAAGNAVKESILENLIEMFTDTFSGIEDGINNLGQ